MPLAQSPAARDRRANRVHVPLFGILAFIVLPLVFWIAGASEALGATASLSKVETVGQSVAVDGSGDALDYVAPVATAEPAAAEPVDTPTPILCDAETVPAWDPAWIGYCWEPDMPVTCAPSEIRAEDGSCVPPSFYAPETEIGDALGDWGMPYVTLAPCADDSGPNAPCYWDARAMGDGQGTSFVVMADGTVYYPEP